MLSEDKNRMRSLKAMFILPFHVISYLRISILMNSNEHQMLDSFEREKNTFLGHH